MRGSFLDGSKQFQGEKNLYELEYQSSDLHPDDIILRSADTPAVSKPMISPVTANVLPSPATKSVADRLKEIEDLYNRKFLTDPEYQEKRAKVIAEL